MKILIDAHCMDRDSAEGITTYIRGLYNELPSIMPDVDFYFAAHDTEKLKQIFVNLPNVHFVRLKSSGRLLRAYCEYPRIVKKLGIDLAHFQYFAPDNIGCETIITLHDILFKDFPQYFPLTYRLSRDFLFRRSARRATILTTVSEYSRKRISKHYGIDPSRIAITPNAVHDDFFDLDRENAQRQIESLGIRKFILNVSRIEPRKNQEALVKAFCNLNLAQKGYDLVLISHQSLRNTSLEQSLASIPDATRRHIHQIGPKPYDEIKIWCSAAELFVFPSLAEGFGIPPLEAAATRTPVICHNDTAMSDYAFFGDNLTDISREGVLESLISKNLDKKPDNLQEISEAIRQRYNWRSSAKILADAIRDSQ